MSNLKRIYQELPFPARWLALQGAAWKKKSLRCGNDYARMLAHSRETETWSREQVRQSQSEQLAALLVEVKRHVPYYRDLYESFSESDLVEIAREFDLKALPFVQKADRKAYPEKFLNSAVETASVGATSGSTGSPMANYIDRNSYQSRYALLSRHREWAGAKVGCRSVRLSGNLIISSQQTKPPFWIRNLAENQLLVSTYHLNDTNLPQVWSAIKRWNPEIIDGYNSAIAIIARYAASVGERLPGLKGAVTTAELLTPSAREEIEKGLGVKVLDYYSASEGIPIALQHPDGNYYVRPESGLFEIIDSNRTVLENSDEVGQIVATSLLQRRTPLIRYMTGDTGSAKRPAQTAFAFDTISQITGRLDDLICTPDGRLLGMFSYRLFKQVPEGLAEAQIVQERPDLITINAVLTGTQSEHELSRLIERKIREMLGFDATVRLNVVDAIPRGPNGKFRSTIRQCEVPSGKVALKSDMVGLE